MRFRTRAVICFCLIVWTGSAPWVLASSEALGSSSRDQEEGWIDLFNGKDLNGWQKARPPRVDPLWVVEEGVMTNLEGSRDIATVDEYSDFDLSLEYKTVEHGNSGVFLRGRIEIQVADTFGKESPSDQDNGAVYGQFAPLVNVSKPAGEWNSLEMNLRGAVLTVRLNGHLIHNALTLPKVCDGALPGGLLDPGPIRLQGDHGKVWYRNLRLRPMGPDSAKASK